MTTLPFLSTLSLRRATTGNASGIHTHWISIHALLAESDYVFAAGNKAGAISIHALLAESDGFDSGTFVPAEKFLSTLSLRRATNTLPGAKSRTPISIHALLAESDSRQTLRLLQGSAISIHALLAESDLLYAMGYYRHGNFYPRSPCGERRQKWRVLRYRQRISIHALLAESDGSPCMIWSNIFLFLSTLSLRRATQAILVNVVDFPISIHALLAESDHYGWSWYDDFTISIHALLAESDDSQGTLYQFSRHISIHALLAESDVLTAGPLCPPKNFYPRSPCGERRNTG